MPILARIETAGNFTRNFTGNFTKVEGDFTLLESAPIKDNIDPEDALTIASEIKVKGAK